jgi:hypothetical protein
MSFYLIPNYLGTGKMIRRYSGFALLLEKLHEQEKRTIKVDKQKGTVLFNVVS